MGGGGKGGSSKPQYIQSPPQNTSSVTTSSPWANQQSFLQKGFEEAQKGYENPLEFYGGSVAGVPTGQTYAPFSLDTQQAINMARTAVLNNEVVPAAQKFSTEMLGGDYLLAGNPYFSGMIHNLNATLRPEIESQYSKAGRYGSGAMDKAYTSALTDTAGNLAYQNYSDVLKGMNQAAYLAPQTAQLGLVPAQQLAQIGGMTEDQTQNAINQEMSKWQFEQMEPWQRLGLYQGGIQGNYGGTTNASGTSSGQGQWIQPRMDNTVGNVGGILSSLAGLGMMGFSLFGGSDKRFKDNIEPFKEDAVEIIKSLKPVTYDYKPGYAYLSKTGKLDQVGFVADDLEKIFPSIVAKDEDGMRYIAPFGLIPVLVGAIQEQQQQIDKLSGTV